MSTKKPLISVLDARDHAPEDKDDFFSGLVTKKQDEHVPSLSFDEALRSAVASSCSSDGAVLNQSTSSTLQNDCGENPTISLMEEMMLEAAKARKDEEEMKHHLNQRKEGQSAFKSAGFKKGFLNSSSPAKSSTNKSESTKRRVVAKKNDGGLALQKGFLNNKPKQQKIKDKTKAVTKKEESFTVLPPLSNNEHYDECLKLLKNDVNCSEEVLHNEKPTTESEKDGDSVITLRANADASLASLRLDEVQDTMDKRDEPCSVSDILLSPSTSAGDRVCGLLQNEVQEAMKENTMGLLSDVGGWATPDLMEKFANNPRLCRFLTDPKFKDILKSLEKNPKATFASLQHEPEILGSLNEFCSLMGDHFLKLDKEKENKESRSIGPLAKEALKRHSDLAGENKIGWDSNVSEEEQNKVNEILADRDLSRILMDPEMQVIIKECSEPGRMVKYMRDPVYGPKLRQLISARLLRVDQ